MASSQPPVANTNGSYLQQADPQSFQANPSAAAAPTYQTQSGAPQQASATETVPKDEVGWYFVEQYYTTLNKTPERLHLFYNKGSSFVWGTEGEILQLATGRSAIQEKIQSYEFKDCKVRVSNVDSQASANNGIVIQVLGEMSNNGLPNRKFSQTFFLAEQPNGYYVLNDIFRYLKDDEDLEEGEEYDEGDVEEILEDPAVEAVVNEAVELAVEELVEAIEDLSTKETVKTEIEIEGDKVKVEETVIVEPALPVTESQDVSPSVNGNIESASGDAPAAEPEANTEPDPEPEAEAEPELEAELEPEPEPEPQVEESAPAAPTVEAVPAPPVEEKKVAPPAVKEPERAPTPVAVPKTTVPATPAVSAVPAVPAAPAAQAAPAPTPAVPVRQTWANIAATKHVAPPALNAAVQSVQTQAASTPSAPPAAAAAASTAATAPTPQNAPATPPGWQLADNKRRTTAQAQIQNVPESVDSQTLKDALSKFGGVKKCEISRVNRGFSLASIEFEAPAGFANAFASNPLQIADASLIIESRPSRPTGAASRGVTPGREARGARGDRGGRVYQPRDGGLNRGEGRGGPTGGRGPRGGPYQQTRTKASAPTGSN